MSSLIGRVKPARAIGLMGHVIADYPSPVAVRQMIQTMVSAGATVIEIQIPFSEPMADGPFFLAANHQALAQGVTYAASLRLMAEVSSAYPHVAFVFMSYLNVVFQRGYGNFVTEAVTHGAAGAIIPDLPLEYAAQLEAAGAAVDFANIRILAPNAPAQRLSELVCGARGILYAVARAGVTGASSDLRQVHTFVSHIRSLTALPVAVGFGVRSAQDVRQLIGHADYAIIGTASLQAFAAGGVEGFKGFWQELSVASDPHKVQ